MYICPVCFQEYSILFMFHLHFTKCQKLSSELNKPYIDTSHVKHVKPLSEHSPPNPPTPPTNDYISWIQSFEITETDILHSFENYISVIESLFIRYNIQSSGIFYISSSNEKCPIYIADKIVGRHNIILSYTWKCLQKADILYIIHYFLDIFKTHFITWYFRHKDDEDDRRVSAYYNNIMIFKNKNVDILKEIIISLLQ